MRRSSRPVSCTRPMAVSIGKAPTTVRTAHSARRISDARPCRPPLPAPGKSRWPNGVDLLVVAFRAEGPVMAGALIVGAGPGIGQAVARRFAREGLGCGPWSNCSTPRTDRRACTSPPSPSAEPSRPGRRTTPTASPSTTGDCTPSRTGGGSAKYSTERLRVGLADACVAEPVDRTRRARRRRLSSGAAPRRSAPRPPTVRRVASARTVPGRPARGRPRTDGRAGRPDSPR